MSAVRHPVTGADRVARFLAGLVTAAPGLRANTTWVNGAPAIRIELDGELHAALSLVVADGRVSRLYAINNPHKLARLDHPASLAR
nr:hypothetical protein [Egibacter rhizosphaerae]